MMTEQTWLIIASGALGIIALGFLSVGVWRWVAPAKRTTYVPRHSGEFPIVPVRHVGAEDSAATSQWVHAIGSVPSLLDDPYIALRSAEEQLRLALARREEALQRVAEFEASRDAKTLDGLVDDCHKPKPRARHRWRTNLHAPTEVFTRR